MTGPIAAAVTRLIQVDCGRIGEVMLSEGVGMDTFWRAGLAVHHPALAAAFFKGEDSDIAARQLAARMRRAQRRVGAPA